MSNISMDEKLADLRKVIFRLSEAGCQLSAENERQSAVLESANSEIDYLKEKVKTLEGDNEFTINYNTELKEEKTALLKDVENLECENQKMSDKIDILEKEKRSLNEKINQLQKDNDKLTRKICDYEEAKNSKKSELQNKLNSAEIKNQELSTENYALKRQVVNQEQMKKDLSRLINQIDDIRKSVRCMKDNEDEISKADDTTLSKSTEKTEQPENDNGKDGKPADDSNKTGYDGSENNESGQNGSNSSEDTDGENSKPPIMIGGMD